MGFLFPRKDVAFSLVKRVLYRKAIEYIYIYMWEYHPPSESKNMSKQIGLFTYLSQATTNLFPKPLTKEGWETTYTGVINMNGAYSLDFWSSFNAIMMRSDPLVFISHSGG